ncbi:MAG: peptidylprolyl isomerase [Coleofasciculaceae cyanobacterium]
MMSQAITIINQDILHQVKLACKVPELTEMIIANKVVIAKAAELGIEVEKEELQKAADQFRFINQLQSAEDTWSWLEKHCLSVDDLEEIIQINLISSKLANHLFADKVEPYFFENQLNYAGAVLYEIVLDDEDLAMELFYAIEEGEMSFYEVAHQYIQEIELRRAGGYRGIVYRQQLKPEISAAVFTAKPTELLKPVVTSLGAHLILVEEIIQPELDGKLRYQILSTLFEEWIKRQMEHIEVVSKLELTSRVT